MMDLFNKSRLTELQDEIDRLNNTVVDRESQIDLLHDEIRCLHTTLDKMEKLVLDAEKNAEKSRKAVAKAHRKVFKVAIKNAELRRQSNV